MASRTVPEAAEPARNAIQRHNAPRNDYKESNGGLKNGLELEHRVCSRCQCLQYRVRVHIVQTPSWYCTEPTCRQRAAWRDMRVLPQGISDIWDSIPVFGRLPTLEFRLLSCLAPVCHPPQLVCQDILGAYIRAVFDCCTTRRGDAIVQSQLGASFSFRQLKARGDYSGSSSNHRSARVQTGYRVYYQLLTARDSKQRG